MKIQQTKTSDILQNLKPKFFKIHSNLRYLIYLGERKCGSVQKRVNLVDLENMPQNDP